MHFSLFARTTAMFDIRVETGPISTDSHPIFRYEDSASGTSQNSGEWRAAGEHNIEIDSRSGVCLCLNLNDSTARFYS